MLSGPAAAQAHLASAQERTEIGADLVKLLAELVAIDSRSPAGDTAAIGVRIADELKQSGYAVQTVRAGQSANVIARIGQGHPSLAFNVHVDTLGPGDLSIWRTEPYVAVEADGRVTGLGASNAKGAAACHLWVARAIAQAGGPLRGEVVFTFVGDEENLGPDGMAELRRQGIVRPDILVVGAPTENQLIVAERGVFWVRLITRGRAVHAGAAPQGDNAILRMMRVLSHIERELSPLIASRVGDSPGGQLHSMINIGTITGGEQPNSVPDRCEVIIDRRLLPSEVMADALLELEQCALSAGEPAGTVSMETLVTSAGFQSRDDGPALAAFKQIIPLHSGAPARFVNAVGVFDGRYFANDGIEILDFGPGEGDQGHAPNESIAIDQMVQSALIQYDVIKLLLGLANSGG